MFGSRMLRKNRILLAMGLIGLVLAACNGTADPTPRSELRRVLHGEDQCHLYAQPTWTRNNRILFLQSCMGMRTMNPDGTDLQTVPNTTKHDLCPDVSPDGKRIVLLAVEDVPYPRGLYVMNLDGTSRTEIPNKERPIGSHEGCPIWSPDATRIAFTSDRIKTNLIYGQLYTMDLNGDHLVQVTHPPYSAIESAWEPNGNRIAFVEGSSYQIWLISPTGEGLVQVTSEKVNPIASHPVWSPDGKWIIYEASVGSDYDANPSGLYAIHPDRTGRRLLLKQATIDALAISPRGDQIVFHSGFSGDIVTDNIYIFDVGDLLNE